MQTRRNRVESFAALAFMRFFKGSLLFWRTVVLRWRLWPSRWLRIVSGAAHRFNTISKVVFVLDARVCCPLALFCTAADQGLSVARLTYSCSLKDILVDRHNLAVQPRAWHCVTLSQPYPRTETLSSYSSSQLDRTPWKGHILQHIEDRTPRTRATDAHFLVFYHR